MREPSAESQRPPGGPRPPGPPTTGGPGGPARHPDPRDPGPPILVHIGGVLIGDLGNQTVDALLLDGILLRGGAVGRWLGEKGMTAEEIETTFAGARWPLADRYTVRLDER